MRLTVTTLLALLPISGLAQEPLIPSFVEETDVSGFAHSFTGGWEYMVGGGTAVFDCSGDGLPEVFVAGGASKAALFRNDSTVGGPLVLEQTSSGLEIEGVSGAYPLDIDSDGRTDLALLRVGPDRVMRGLGNCQFEDASVAWGFDGLDLWSTAFAAVWEEGMAWPTLAIGSYIDRRQEAFPWGSCTPNHLYRPNPTGNGFAAPTPLEPGYCALSILFTNWDNRGRPDLRVSNDREYYKGGQEQMWRLDPGEPPALFTEAEGWKRLRIWGMGISQEDLNFDGFPEYFLTSMADNKLQTLAAIPAGGAAAQPTYRDIALPSGVTAHRPYMGDDLRPSTAWHAQFGDVNNDGLADLFVVKGNIDEMPDFASFDPNNLLLQRVDDTFVETGDRAGVASGRRGRGGALADLNADGLLDIVVVNRNEPAQVWRNTTDGAGHWIAVRLQMDGSNPDAIGARIELRRPDGRIQSRDVQVGGGHAGGQLGAQHFGLGDATEAELRVIWPDGQEGDWVRVGSNATYRLAPDSPPERE